MKMSHFFSVSDTLWNLGLLILNFSQLKLGTFKKIWQPPPPIWTISQVSPLFQIGKLPLELLIKLRCHRKKWYSLEHLSTDPNRRFVRPLALALPRKIIKKLEIHLEHGFFISDSLVAAVSWCNGMLLCHVVMVLYSETALWNGPCKWILNFKAWSVFKLLVRISADGTLQIYISVGFRTQHFIFLRPYFYCNHMRNLTDGYSNAALLTSKWKWLAV